MKQIHLNKSLSYRTYPHRCELDSLEFEVTQYTLNGGSPSEPDGDGFVDLTEYEGWDTLELELEATIPEGLLGKVFPEFGKIPGMLVVTAHCRGTYLRDRFVLERDPLSSGTYRRTWEFDADDVTGAIDLRPVVVRTEDTNESLNYATDAGVFVADGPEWRVEISDEESESEDLFEIRRRSFREENESDPESRFPPEDQLYYLDVEMDAESPVVWLNEDHERVLPLLQSPEDQYEKLTSELAWNQVMTPVWTRLVIIAARQYDPEDEDWQYEWQGAVFEQLSDELYAEHSPEKAAERLGEDLGQAVEQATKRIDQAVQDLLEPAEYYTKHIQALSER